jgi:peptidoglycan/xylan/chitin deacetylase (PgdA/CDA1 family)
MADPLHGRGPSREALSKTVGPLAAEPGAMALGAGERARLERRRDALWDALEERAGALAGRDAAAWYEILAYERLRGGSRAGGLSPTMLAGFYRVKRFIPRSVQLRLRRGLIARTDPPAFPAWPLESAGADLVTIALADALLDRGVEAVRFPWFWPRGARAAVTLTHDVESAEGLARASVVAGWEERHGFRSSFNIVADSYPVDMRLVADLAERGHEIGSHGLRHDRSLFASRRAFERRLPALREAAQRFGAVGFRSPATHRVVEWLAELPFSYDCTMPHSDPFEPVPGGCATVWPFFHGDVVELPYTAPQDHTLFNLLGHSDCTLWRRQLESVVACNGLFQPITHPDPEYLGRPLIADAYRELLEAIAHREALWVALPREVADWWRRRAAGLTAREDGLVRWNGSEIELVPRTGSRSL